MRILLIAALLSFYYLQGFAQQAATTVILVRHAEKDFDKSGDPSLTEEGRERAIELARLLKEQRVDAIYSTPFKRTKETVTPLAKQKDLRIEEYNPFKLEDVLKVLEASTGRVIVVSGHSNTTPVLLNLMVGEERFKQLDESAYDNIYIASFKSVGNTEVLHLKFGKPQE